MEFFHYSPAKKKRKTNVEFLIIKENWNFLIQTTCSISSLYLLLNMFANCFPYVSIRQSIYLFTCLFVCLPASLPDCL